jgi:hypothetical protein
MRAGRAVEISVSPLFSLLQREDLGEPHTLLAGGERYFSPRFAVEAEEVFQRELQDAGLGDRKDYLEFLDLVNVVQRATSEFYGWVAGVDGFYGVLVATHGRHAVCVVRSGESVRFERCDVDQVMETLVLRLPENSVGQGDPISVGHGDFHAPRSRTPGRVLRRAAARPDGARRLDALLDAQRLHVTKLYAAKRDDRGVRSRSDWWITVLDLVEGRWALSVAQRRREKWIDAAPGTPQLIAEKLVALARSVR